MNAALMFPAHTNLNRREARASEPEALYCLRRPSMQRHTSQTRAARETRGMGSRGSTPGGIPKGGALWAPCKEELRYDPT